MKRYNKTRINYKVILLILLNIIIIPVIMHFSFALNNDITSSTYEIKNNKIYAIPTTYNYRVEELLSNISSDKEIKIYNSNDEELKLGDNVYNGCKVKTESNSYEIVLMGDVTGDGLIEIGDISRLYNHFRGTKTFDGIDLEAGKLTDNNEITIGDISKLYNYYRGKKPFSNFNQNMIDVDNIVSEANDYYLSGNNKLGTNVINELNVEHEDNDQVVVTRKGKVEVAIKKEDKCYRKSALSNYIDVIDSEYCDVKVDKFYSNNGALHISGSKIMNENNEEIRLTGVATTSDLVKQGDILYSNKSLSTLRNWGSNILRVFVHHNFYLVDDQDTYMEHLYRVIDNAINQDMYVIVNWHSNVADLTYSTEMFRTVVSKYKDDSHVLYEIWNEPRESVDTITNYANQIIPVIRSIAPNSVILVASEYSDTRPDLYIGRELPYDNIMYTYHIYSESMNEAHVENLSRALDAGIPVFVSEWAATVSTYGFDTNQDSVYEAQGNAFAKLFKKYNLSYSYFVFADGLSAARFVPEGQWDESLPNSILKSSAKFFKKLLREDYSTSSNMMIKNDGALANGGVYYRSLEWKDKIESIDFKDTLSVPDNAVITWDLSLIKDESVIGYLVPSDTEGLYKMTICANGKINAPINSNYLFAGMSNLKSINFENFVTKGTKVLSRTFEEDQSLESVDLSGLDLSEITNIRFIVHNCKKLTSINFGNTFTDKLERVDYAFSGSGLTEIDLSGINVSGVINFERTFSNVYYLERVNISTWNPKDGTNFKCMFKGSKRIQSIDMSNLHIDNDDDITEILSGVSGATITIKNKAVEDLLKTQDSTDSNLIFKYKYNNDDGITGDVDWNFEAESGTLSITGSGNMADYNEDILPPWYQYRNQIVKVYVGEDITRIGTYAFYNLTDVVEFRIDAKSLSRPTSRYHYSTYNLGNSYGATLIFGENVTVVPYMFMSPDGDGKKYTNNITGLVFEGNKITQVSQHGLAHLSIPMLVVNDNLKDLNYYSFGAGKMYLIVLPDSLNTINSGSFLSNHNLEKIVFGSSVNSIQDNVLGKNDNLKTVVLPHIDDPNSVYSSNFNGTSDHNVTVYGDSSTQEWVRNINSALKQNNVIYKPLSEYRISISSNSDISGSVSYNDSFTFSVSGNVKVRYKYTNMEGNTIYSNDLFVTKDGDTYTINNIKQDIYIEVQ